jgi:hypothetical protein
MGEVHDPIGNSSLLLSGRFSPTDLKVSLYGVVGVAEIFHGLRVVKLNRTGVW